MCKETKALSNYRKIEKYNLFKSAQKTWSTANCKVLWKKLCRLYTKEHIFLSKIKLINNIEESNLSEKK